MLGFSFKNLKNNELIFLLEIILLLRLNKVNSQDCITHSYSELNYLKAITLDNEYKVIVTGKGIYSFYPKLSTVAYSYNFIGDQILSQSESHSFINNADLSQFSGEEGGNKYVLCIIKQTIYVLNEKGNLLFYQDISTDLQSYEVFTLVAYKYLDNEYFFTIGFTASYINSLKLLYFKITFNNENNGVITKISDIMEKPSYNGKSFWINSKNISCKRMKESNNIVLICFAGFSDISNYIAAFKYNPDEELSLISMSNSIEDSDGKNMEYIKSAINNESNKALVCYNILGSIGKCLYYDINQNELHDIFIDSNYCSFYVYGLNSYFFPKSNEFIFSCVDDLSHFYMMRLYSNFSIIEDNTFNGIQFNGITNFNTFSIIYISQYKAYSVIFSSLKNSQHNLLAILLSNICVMPSGEKEDDENLPTTIPKIPTTIPKLPTTTPETKTTLITIIPILETTIQNIISTNPMTLQESTIMPEIKTSFPKISTIPEKIENTEYNTESLCKDNDKIYYEGKCICDKNKGYFSINSRFSENKCYKKHELPKNLYYNEITQSYELCYKTCATCLEGGNLTQNNCLTCATNYINEPENNSKNCVDKCKYYYYYNSLNRYTCTEDEQCPKEASLIIREKNKCINNCMNDNIYKYQYNGECLSSCPINTEIKQLNICQISDVTTCSLSDFELNLGETIDQENVKIAAKNYAKEFYYTINHISQFISQNFTMILYKNNSCIDELKLNITKIDYDSCIEQLKIDNNINENKELIIAIIDIVNGDNPLTSFGFFNPDTGEKLDATKSCSDKSVIMYENILNILNNPLSLKLLAEQNINIFDINSKFYHDICYHYDSPNGKDATLIDRIKTFYPNITLCDNNCNKVGINFTTMKAECQCAFQDLLSKNIFQNDLIGNNVLIKESLEEVIEMVNNLNIEVMGCYKDVFTFIYFLKNTGGFIILGILILETICFIFYYLKSKRELIKYIYSLTEIFSLKKYKDKININEEKNKIINPPKKKRGYN